jgi:hypothetical protein
MSETEAAEAASRRDQLAKELDDVRSKSDKVARSLERRLTFLFWLQLATGATATLLGLTGFEGPRVVGTIAGIATGCAVVARETRWREKAHWFYTRREIAHGLLNRLRFEMPYPITLEKVTEVSSEYRQKLTELGLRMYALNTGSPSVSGQRGAKRHAQQTAHNKVTPP